MQGRDTPRLGEYRTPFEKRDPQKSILFSAMTDPDEKKLLRASARGAPSLPRSVDSQFFLDLCDMRRDRWYLATRRRTRKSTHNFTPRTLEEATSQPAFLFHFPRFFKSQSPTFLQIRPRYRLAVLVLWEHVTILSKTHISESLLTSQVFSQKLKLRFVSSKFRTSRSVNLSF